MNSKPTGRLIRVHSDGDRNSKTLRVVAQNRQIISFSVDSPNSHPNSARKIADLTFVNLSPDRRRSSFRNISSVMLTCRGEFSEEGES
jgi:hypothetical protein